MQALPSSHGEVLFAFTHPVAGLHESSVHGVAVVAAQRRLRSRRLPPEQASPVVHAFPSSHGAALFAFTQPDRRVARVVRARVPVVAVRSRACPRTRLPSRCLPVVHAFPSLQEPVTAV